MAGLIIKLDLLSMLILSKTYIYIFSEKAMRLHILKYLRPLFTCNAVKILSSITVIYSSITIIVLYRCW